MERNPSLTKDGFYAGGLAEKNFSTWQQELKGAEALWNIYLTTAGYVSVKKGKAKVLKLMRPLNSSALFGRTLGGYGELGALRFNQHCIPELMKRFHTQKEIHRKLNSIYGGENMKLKKDFQRRRENGMYATGFSF